MSRVEDIEKRVKDLSPDELASFRQWFLEFDNDLWERQIESDAAAGRLDAFADEALRHLDGRGVDPFPQAIDQAGAGGNGGQDDEEPAGDRAPPRVRAVRHAPSMLEIGSDSTGLADVRDAVRRHLPG